MDSSWKRKAPSALKGRKRVMPRKRTIATGSALAVGTVVITAGLASAHEPQVTPACDASQHHSTLTVQADRYNGQHQNSVDIAIDNGATEHFTFGESFPAKTYTLSSTASHHYVVQFTAWDDRDGSQGWTRKFEGDIAACEQPPVTPPPHHHPKHKHPKAHLSTNCTGHVRAVLNNKKSNVKVPFVLTASKRTWSTGWKVVVKKHHTRVYHFHGRKFDRGTVIGVRAGGKLLDRIKVPPRCPKPPTTPPDTGYRIGSSTAYRTAAPRLMVPAIGVNAPIVQVGKTQGGAQAVTHSVSDVFPLA
jgi:hypothetical protein